MELEYLERVVDANPQAVQDEIASLRKLVRQATQDARMLLFELRPIILETQGLVPALQSYVDRLEENDRFVPHFECGELLSELSPSVAGTVFSIVQEAITNIEKHAEARNVWIRLRKEQNQLVVVVEDDGKGFDVEFVTAHYDQGESFGLLNMKERAALIDGVLILDSKPHRQEPGTKIELRVALEETGRANDG
jgi:signal transduction histidine kinase